MSRNSIKSTAPEVVSAVPEVCSELSAGGDVRATRVLWPHAAMLEFSPGPRAGGAKDLLVQRLI